MRNVLIVSGIAILALVLVLAGVGIGWFARGGWSTAWMSPFQMVLGSMTGCSGLGSYGQLALVMMGSEWTSGSGASSLEEAVEAAEEYAASFNESFKVAEVMQFDNHFYAIIEEVDTGIGAFEILIDPQTGAIQPEHGPTMMWNAKYGMMGGAGSMMSGSMMGRGSAISSNEMSVSPSEAIRLAQQYLDRAYPGVDAGDEADAFYGYYTIHTEVDGEVAGMLSVHGETGQVWLHSWHGTFIAMTDHADH